MNLRSEGGVVKRFHDVLQKHKTAGSRNNQMSPELSRNALQDVLDVILHTIWALDLDLMLVSSFFC